MSSAQRVVLAVAVVAAVLMLAFPPWETPGGHFLGYAPLTAPPSGEDPRPESGAWAFEKPEPLGRVSLGVLTGQLAVLWIAAGALFFLLGPGRRGEKSRVEAKETKPPIS